MRIFSGIQPTGELHIGNYLGAIKQWIQLQEKNKCIFCVVDLHAITVPYDAQKLQELILEKAIVYLAAGIDPKKSIIFTQSKVKEHTELAWLLNTITPMGELGRMTQYKEKSQKFREAVNAGLFNYPVLMAADILLYQTQIVPVGQDQIQHVELARSIARKFNQKFGKTFDIPEAKILKVGAKIMSLAEPRKKMSKSDSPDTRIGLFDDPEIIRKKIMRAVTDTGSEIKYDVPRKPGISNLLVIYSLFKNISIKSAEREFKEKSYLYFKRNLAELLVDSLSSFRQENKKLRSRDNYVQNILDDGAKKAEDLAKETMIKVKRNMGL